MESSKQNDLLINAEKQIKISIYIFTGSFIIGTLILITYLFFKTDNLIMLGIAYVLFAFPFNSIVFLNNIIYLSLSKQFRLQLTLCSLLLLLNVPITFFYISLI